MSRFQDSPKNNSEEILQEFADMLRNTYPTMDMDEAMQAAKNLRDATDPKNYIQNSASGLNPKEANQELEFLNQFSNSVLQKQAIKNGSSRFLSPRSEEVLNSIAVKMNHGFGFEDAIKNSVDEMIDQLGPDEQGDRIPLLAASAEIKDYIKNSGLESDVATSFLMGGYRNRNK